MDYWEQLVKLPSRHPRILSNSLFLLFVAAPVLPKALRDAGEDVEDAIRMIRRAGFEIDAKGFEPWECTFLDACVQASRYHRWQDSLNLFETANATSQQLAKYFWWYPALLASVGRVNDAISLLDAVVRAYASNSVAAITDLATLLILARRFSEAEQLLSAALDMMPEFKPAIALCLCLYYEAQDRQMEAGRVVLAVFKNLNDNRANLTNYDWHGMLLGMCSLIAGKEGSSDTAEWTLDVLTRGYKKQRLFSAVEVALAYIGNKRHDEAVKWLKKAAFEDGDPFTMWLHIFPPLRHLHGHKGYRELLSKLNLKVGLYG
jgi:tetratricopeptide (TPR) repeat protein